MSAPVDVRIDGKSGHMEGMRHDDGRGLMPHARKLFQCIESLWHFAPMMFEEVLRKFPDRAGFCGGEAARADDLFDLLRVELRHFFGRAGFCKELGSREIHPGIGALGGKENGDEKGVRIFMLERNLGMREHLI